MLFSNETNDILLTLLIHLKETFELLTKTIQKKQSYQDFLETVVNMAKNDFLNVQSFMNRILVLVEIRWYYSMYDHDHNHIWCFIIFLLYSNILKNRIKTAFDENVHEARNVEIHNENTQKELMKNLGRWTFLKSFKVLLIF